MSASLGRRHLLALALLRRGKQLALSRPASRTAARQARTNLLLLTVCGSFGLFCAVENLVRKPQERLRAIVHTPCSPQKLGFSLRKPSPNFAHWSSVPFASSLLFLVASPPMSPAFVWPFGLGQPPLCMQGGAGWCVWCPPGHGRKDVSIFQRPRHASPCHTPGTRAKLASGALCHTAPAQSARSS